MIIMHTLFILATTTLTGANRYASFLQEGGLDTPLTCTQSHPTIQSYRPSINPGVLQQALIQNPHQSTASLLAHAHRKSARRFRSLSAELPTIREHVTLPPLPQTTVSTPHPLAQDTHVTLTLDSHALIPAPKPFVSKTQRLKKRPHKKLLDRRPSAAVKSLSAPASNAPRRPTTLLDSPRVENPQARQLIKKAMQEFRENPIQLETAISMDDFSWAIKWFGACRPQEPAAKSAVRAICTYLKALDSTTPAHQYLMAKVLHATVPSGAPDGHIFTYQKSIFADPKYNTQMDWGIITPTLTKRRKPLRAIGEILSTPHVLNPAAQDPQPTLRHGELTHFFTLKRSSPTQELSGFYIRNGAFIRSKSIVEAILTIHNNGTPPSSLESLDTESLGVALAAIASTSLGYMTAYNLKGQTPFFFQEEEPVTARHLKSI